MRRDTRRAARGRPEPPATAPVTGPAPGPVPDAAAPLPTTSPAPAGNEARATDGADAAPDFRAAAGRTLIIDPTLPNLVPRLPVWDYTTADEAGWDKENWPAVRQLNHVSRLKEAGWEVLADDAVLLTKPEQAPPVPGPTAPPAPAPSLPSAPSAPSAPETQPATASAAVAATGPAPTTRAATLPSATSPTTAGVETKDARGSGSGATPAAADASEALLWADRDGTRYYDGAEALRVVSPAGRTTTWALPPAAAGKAPVHLVKTEDGRLFLFNQPGRVLRIKPTPEAAEPFVVDATFTRNVPNVDAPSRVWLDPAGRIIIAYENKLAILFPEGYVPPAIRGLMSDADEMDEGEGK